MKTLRYEYWLYDVWGNAEEGYEVNDRSCEDRNVAFRCKDGYAPTMRQLAKFLGCKPSEIEREGDGDNIYVNEYADGKPLCEFIKCVED